MLLVTFRSFGNIIHNYNIALLERSGLVYEKSLYELSIRKNGDCLQSTNLLQCTPYGNSIQHISLALNCV